MISEYKLENGEKRYIVRIRYRGQRISESFDSKEEAKKWQIETQNKRDCGKDYCAKVTAEMLLDAYLKRAKIKKISTSQIANVKRYHRNYVEPYFKTRNVVEVEIEEFLNFFIYLNEKKKLSGATCNRVRSYLKTCFRYAMKNKLFGGLVKFDPIDALDAFSENKKERKRKRKIPSKTDLQKFIKANENSYYWPLWSTFMYKGLRVGEVVALYAEEIDMKRHLMTICRTFVEETNSIEERTKSTRGDASDGVRTLAIPKNLQDVLYPILPQSGAIFKKPDGTELTPNYIRQFALKQACEAAGLDPFNPHDFRHAFATYYLDKGDIRDVQKELGHRDLKTTEDNYVHENDEQLQRRAEKATGIYEEREQDSHQKASLSQQDLLDQLSEMVANKLVRQKDEKRTESKVLQEKQNVVQVDFFNKQRKILVPGQKTSK